MKKIPWKSLAIGCGITAVMVLVRCIVTAGRFLYYGGSYWQSEVMADPWFYIGMVAAAVCVASLLVLSEQEKNTENKIEDKENGCGE